MHELGIVEMRSWITALTVMTLAGCSVHPIPDDISPLPTEEIVRNMRCEVKDAVRKEIKAHLDDLDRRTYGVYHAQIAQIVPDDILSRPNLALLVRTGPYGSKLAAKFVLISKLSLAYAFEFDITENNTAAADLSFMSPFSKSLFTLDATGGLAKQREAKRVFQTVETFAELRDLDCSNWVIRDGNLIYPITGSIGMAKVVHTFITLTELGAGGGSLGASQAPAALSAASQAPTAAHGKSKLGMGDLALSELSAGAGEALGQEEVRLAQNTVPETQSGTATDVQPPKPASKTGTTTSKTGTTTSKTGTTTPKTGAKASKTGTTTSKTGTTASKTGATTSKAGTTTQLSAAASIAPAQLFTDTLTFTTTWTGGLNPQLQINPVPKSFRLVNANVNLTAGRTDVHKVTISLQFPDPDQYRNVNYQSLPALLKLVDAAPVISKADAYYNLCVARARDREDDFNTLRLYPPEQSCLENAPPRTTPLPRIIPGRPQ
jgi:hypothetical protein